MQPKYKRVNMKKHLIIACAIASFMMPSASQASGTSSEDTITNVKAFYMELQDKMNTSDYDTALSIIDKRFADDFLHYDDGEVSYGKDGMILFVENHKNTSVRTSMDIDFTSAQFDAEKNEVTTHFKISQKFFKHSDEDGTEYEDKDSRIQLTCEDSLRVQDAENFQLYKCNCVTSENETTKPAQTQSE
tara:strand:+ start:2452 stop:3018 length:567 start_codon:yes stop_codon:yes gene_type:complete